MTVVVVIVIKVIDVVAFLRGIVLVLVLVLVLCLCLCVSLFGAHAVVIAVVEAAQRTPLNSIAWRPCSGA
jgi:hypothetical protein